MTALSYGWLLAGTVLILAHLRLARRGLTHLARPVTAGATLLGVAVALACTVPVGVILGAQPGWDAGLPPVVSQALTFASLLAVVVAAAWAHSEQPLTRSALDLGGTGDLSRMLAFAAETPVVFAGVFVALVRAMSL